MTRFACALCLLIALDSCSDDNKTNPTGNNNGHAGDGDSKGDGDGTNDPDHPILGDGDGDGDGSSSPAGDGGAGCERTLRATIRDFKFAHPDFENDAFESNVATLGLVKDDLGADHKPVFNAIGAPQQLTDEASFKQWYNDTDGVNTPVPFDITLEDDGSGKYVYDNQAFFPIDGKGFGNEGMDDNATPHNFAFTTEIHTEFQYKGGEVFTFIGDDDLWMFINGKLAIDLGGLHPKLPKTVNLDDAAATLGITKGNKYRMDIFHAERHTTASTFRVETTIECLTPVVL